MHRWVSAGAAAAALAVLLPAFAAAADYKLNGKVTIKNTCSTQEVTDDILITITVALNDTDEATFTTKEKPGTQFSLPKSYPAKPKNWKIVSVLRTDKTPICSCLCCDPILDKTTKKVQKCQQHPTALGSSEVDNDTVYEVTVTCECKDYVPDP